MARSYGERDNRRPTKRQAKEWMEAAEQISYLPPSLLPSGKVPKGTVLRGFDPSQYDRRAALLDKAATEWLRASKKVGRTAITNEPYRRESGKSQSQGLPRLHGSGPSTKARVK